MKRLCIYHSRDLDGWMSAAIVKLKFPDTIFIGWDYGKLYPFRCASEAERILRGKGIKANARNIRSICNNQIDINKRNSKPYVRKIAGGFRWFNADDVEKYKNLIND